MSRRCLGCMELYNEQFDVCPHCGYVYGTPAQEAYHLQPGSRLKEKYLVGKVLGFGGFGVTYIGYDLILGKKVAIKEYLPGEFSTRMPNQQNVTIYTGEREEQFEEGKKKTLDEAQRLAQFQNDRNIVNVFDQFEENNTAYIVMEYCDGESVKKILENQGKLPLDLALHITKEVIAGMKSVHKVGMLHRDIAPDNIYVLKDGRVKILDFGAARYASTKHSRSLSVIIKPGYAPEEQYRSRGDQGPWTDVYALAATFYKMITGITPNDAMERSVTDMLKKPSKCGVEISKPMETAVMNALNIAIQDRTQSMEEFEKELEAAEVKEKADTRVKADVGGVSASVKIGAAIGGGIAVALLVVALLVGQKFKGASVPEGKTIVPNIVNLTQERADEKGAEAELNLYATKQQPNLKVPKGRIIEQYTDKGTIVEKNSDVEYSVSTGLPTAVLPDLAGLSALDAEAMLKELGFKVKTEEISDRTRKAGSVVDQSIAANEAAELGSTITLSVVKDEGQEKVDSSIMVDVPDLSGMSQAEAEAILAGAEFITNIVNEPSDDIEKGYVIRYEDKDGNILSAGAQLGKNSTITVVISSGKEMITIPSGIVYEMTEADARKRLEDLGFTVTVKEAYGSARAGYVEALSVEEGQTAEKGSQITVTISRGPQPRETQAPRQTQAAPPQTQPAPRQTQPPQTAPPQTAPPQTAPPQTAPPQTAPPANPGGEVMPDNI